MLIGEQIVPIAKRAIAGEPITVSWFHAECSSKITGIETKKIVAQDLAERASHDEPHGLL
jgi:xanthosine utilization system XapX-like protein